MKCVNHPEKEAVKLCNHCGKTVCTECLLEIKGENYCKQCIAIKMGEEGKKEHSPALAAILSFIIAGAGQIYNGQIGKGILIFLTAWLVIPWIIGIIDAYKTAVRINQGEITVESKSGCLIGAIVIIIVFFVGIAVIGMLAAIAIPNFMKAKERVAAKRGGITSGLNLTSNESVAKSTLKTISSAVEAYHEDNGHYPLGEYYLTSSQPPYLKESYNGRNISGYIIYEDFDTDNYKIIAIPEKCGTTGKEVFSIEVGGEIVSKDCE